MMPIESGCRIQSRGVAIERYWWMRAIVIGWVNTPSPVGLVGSFGGSPRAIRFALPASISRTWSSSNPAALAVRSAIRSELGGRPYG